jgi:hypothetical protein
MLFIPAYTLLGGSRRVRGDLLSRNRTFTAQKLKKMLQCGRIAAGGSDEPKAISQILRNKIGRDALQNQLSAFKPSAETGGEKDLPVDCWCGISLRP